MIPIPQTITAKASGRSRLPSQARQGRAAMYRSISWRVWSDSVFL